MEQKTLTYLDRPLVRCGNEIYYGNMTDKYIILMKILSTKKAGDVDIASKVHIDLLYTDPDIKGKSKIFKSADRGSMSEALDIASVWLSRYLA